ncbi:MAG: hypothetical protein LUC47_07720 [Clostridiales bacterium]|nr:hypothetical protein [Clostridiales bacterium]
MTPNLPVMCWLTKRPEQMIQNALLTRAANDGSRYLEMGAVPGKDDEWGRNNILAYMLIPHINEQSHLWKSEYLGDELPSTSGEYLCCAECNDNINPRGTIRLLWYDGKTARFGGTQMIGYMPVPASYSGRDRLEEARQ